jgi:hypothetical protein
MYIGKWGNPSSGGGISAVIWGKYDTRNEKREKFKGIRDKGRKDKEKCS